VRSGSVRDFLDGRERNSMRMRFSGGSEGHVPYCYLRWWHEQHPGRRAEYQRRWRERNGDRYNATRRQPPLESRTCPVCQPRSRCAKRADNLNYRALYRPRRAYV
jgi:hypothetical protein